LPNQKYANLNSQKVGGCRKETLIKSNNFQLVKSTCKSSKDRRNGVTITAHFEKLTSAFLCAEILST